MGHTTKVGEHRAEALEGAIPTNARIALPPYRRTAD